MKSDPQTLVALLIVAVAASVLLRRAIGWWRGQSASGCGGGCHGCGNSVTPPQQPKISLPIIERLESTPHEHQS